MTSECLERPIPKRTLWTSAGSTIPTMSWRKVQGWQGAYFIQQTAQIWLWPNPSTPEEWAWLELSVDIIQPTLFVSAAKRDFKGQSEGCFESWEFWSIDLKIWWLEARYDVPAHRPHLVVLLQDRSSTGVRRLTQSVFIPGLKLQGGATPPWELTSSTSTSETMLVAQKPVEKEINNSRCNPGCKLDHGDL